MAREMHIEKYIINHDLTVDVNGDVDLGIKNLTQIPIQFGIVNGHFSLFNNKLTSLKGCPQKVKGNFDCTHNKLISLQYCPKEVGEDFRFHANQISTFEYLPDSVGSFVVYENDIINLNINKFKTKINEDFIHSCTSEQCCNKFLKDFYIYETESYYKYGVFLSAQQFNAILLNNELGLELNQNNPFEKKMKI